MLWFIPVIGVAFFFVGMSILSTPAEELLLWDRRAGRSVYRSARDHETGMRRARTFYRWFGAVIMALGPTLAVGVTMVGASS